MGSQRPRKSGHSFRALPVNAEELLRAGSGRHWREEQDCERGRLEGAWLWGRAYEGAGLVGRCVRGPHLALLLIKYPLDCEDSSVWGARPFHLCARTPPMPRTQKVLHKCVSDSVSESQPPYPSSCARVGFIQGNRQARQSCSAPRPLPHEVGAGPGPPAALVHALDHCL